MLLPAAAADVERPADSTRGDFATTVALKLARPLAVTYIPNYQLILTNPLDCKPVWQLWEGKQAVQHVM